MNPVYMNPSKFPVMRVSFDGWGDRLNAVLEEKGITDLRCADETGLTDTTVGKYRSGLGNPTLKSQTLLINYLQVDPEWLHYGVQPRQDYWFLDRKTVSERPQDAIQAITRLMTQMLDILQFATEQERS